MFNVYSKKQKKKNDKKKGEFSYEGETFSTNPFAACSKNIDRKTDKAKWERCVKHVKKSSEV